MRATQWVLVVLPAVLFMGCGGGDEVSDPEAAARAEAVPPGYMGTMSGAEDAGGMAMDSAMHSRMLAHMQSMQGISADSFQRMLPAHIRMADSLMMGMPRGMGQGPAAQAWQQLADSLREDLRRMEGMEAAELEAFMPEHHARVTRLLEMHGPMGGMQH